MPGIGLAGGKSGADDAAFELSAAALLGGEATESEELGREVPRRELADTQQLNDPEEMGQDANANSIQPREGVTPVAGEQKTEVAAPSSSPAPAARPAAAAKNVIGDYRLIKKLGQGGMGTVFKAHQMSLDREVALKVLSKEMAARQPALVQRFQREARVMARLDHPNILRCYEVGQFGGLHYFTMEYVDGGSVQDWLARLGKLPVGDALHIVLECARGLQHAHEQSMIHRDIKPENILLTRKGVVKVADLGLAKAQDENLDLTRTGVGAGTPVYMAPEQGRDVKHVDQRSDIYSLGCMLYCLMTGQAPFKGETLIELFEAKTKGNRSPARTFNSEIPGRLDLIIDKMTAPRPDHRYQSCDEVIAALEELGLANDRLTFLGNTAVPTAQKSAAPARRPGAAPGHSPARSSAPAPPRFDEPPVDAWYVKLEAGDGEVLTKKMDTEKLNGMIRHGTVSAQTLVSRSFRGEYRKLGTFAEFTSLVQAKAINARADRKGEKFRNLYEKIEKDEQRRHTRRWLHNLVLRAGGLVGLLIWLAILAALAVGAYFLISQGLMDVLRRIGLAVL